MTKAMQTPFGLAEAAAAIQRKMVSPLELVEDCLSRIARFEPSLSAWVVVDSDTARETARRMTEELAHGTVRGPVHGIPVGVKDIVDVSG